MKSYDILISVILMLCLINVVCAAANNTAPTWLSSDGGHHGKATGGQASVVITPNGVVPTKVAAMNAAVQNAVAFTPTPVSGNCMDNSKKIAVYMPALTNPVYSETTKAYVNLPVTFDPLTTAMLSEYNPDYLGDSTIAGGLTTAKYSLLIVPMSQMSDATATTINTYIANGGSVWFLNDPCLTPTGTTSANRITVLGSGLSGTISSASTVTVINTDDITNGLPASFKPVGTTSKTSEFRTLSGSGVSGGMNYQVLMSSGSNAMLVKFENPTTGARVIYSNPNMFISGGTSSYFNAQTASKLFIQTKAWVMRLAQNPSGVEITYPNSDKQLTVTCDDEEATSWDTPITPFLNAETSAGITPSAVNTFYIIPSADITGAQLAYYAANGDTHTLHPHLTVWDTAGTSVASYKTLITNNKNIMNNAAGVGDYGFTSWRFPMTTYCTNSLQAVSESGFTIETSNGDGTDGALIGNSQDNTVLFPKQLLINNAKSSLIELEIPAGFDIDYTSGSAYASAYNAYTNQFKNGNFPMNFVVSGHYQGIGVNGLSSWGVTATDLTQGFSSILTTQKAANPNYANFNTLTNYINGVKSAKIVGSVSGSATTVTVTNTKPITDFTLKVTIGNVLSATCDGSTARVKQDSLTGSTYVTANLAAGTHIFVITGTNSPVPPGPTSILPVASLSASVSGGNSPLPVTFTSTSANADSVSWNFGDGTSAVTGSPVTHTFTSTVAKTFTVTLTASNINGSSSATTPIAVTIAPLPPVALFTISPATGTTATTFTFTDTSTNTPTGWAWTFSDGGSASGKTVTHKYTSAGTKTVTLTAKNAVGSGKVSKTVTVTNVPVPVPTIAISPSTGTTATTFTFTGSATNSPTGWSWQFGDGGSASGKTVTHKYTSAGTKTVTLTAKNAAGSGKVSKTVAVSKTAPPVAAFTASRTSGPHPLTVTFTDKSTGTVSSRKWTFGDGGTATTASVSHKFTTAKKYTVTLVVTNAGGSSSKAMTITAT